MGQGRDLEILILNTDSHIIHYEVLKSAVESEGLPEKCNTSLLVHEHSRWNIRDTRLKYPRVDGGESLGETSVGNGGTQWGHEGSGKNKVIKYNSDKGLSYSLV